MVEMNSEGFVLKLLQGLAGLIILVGFFIPWARGGVVNFFGFEKLVGTVTFVAGWFLIVGSLINFDAFNSQMLEGLKSLSNIVLGVLGGILGLAGTLSFRLGVPPSFHLSWGIYITILGSIVGVLSSFGLYLTETGGGLGRRPRRRSGGL